ncbi:GAP family protein [Microbacterium sp. BK668]|uniref:GAP family protein n=1 Tax=Microbacterium sp. BK668 TaxID=2512118 RepID=UPI0010621446|nr:GAP family protein [Microbacterium sp. BK668]TDN90709.1 Sap-like sulfolipid-1-addressing protein [Microbacterium sp. BK668]
MDTLILHIVPIAIAVAFSTVPILAVIVILLSPFGSRSAIPFLVGWVSGLFLVALLMTVLAQFLPDHRVPGRSERTIGWLEIAVGAAIVVAGAWTMLRSRRRSEHATPKWLASIEKLGPWSSLGFGLLLNVRPKGLLLAIATGLALQADAQTPTETAVALVLYTAIGSSTVVIPVIASIVARKEVQPRLVAAREWLLGHGDVLTGAILVFVGIIVVVVGVQRL